VTHIQLIPYQLNDTISPIGIASTVLLSSCGGTILQIEGRSCWVARLTLAQLVQLRLSKLLEASGQYLNKKLLEILIRRFSSFQRGPRRVWRSHAKSLLVKCKQCCLPPKLAVCSLFGQVST